MLIKIKHGLFIVLITTMLLSCISGPKLNKYSGYAYSVDLQFGVFQNVYTLGPYISISINNDNHLAFFDTGMADRVGLMLTKEDIEKHGFEEIGEHRFASLDKFYSVSEYILPDIVIDNKFTIENINISERPQEYLSGGSTMSIGLSPFKDYNILISYEQKKLFLYPKDISLAFLRNWTKVDIIKRENSTSNEPTFYGNVVGLDKQYVFYLDTGSSLYDVKTDTVADLILTREIRDFATENRQMIYEFSGRKFTINRWAFLGDINQNAPIDAFIGHYILQQYDIFLDLDNGAFYIEN